MPGVGVVVSCALLCMGGIEPIPAMSKASVIAPTSIAWPLEFLNSTVNSLSPSLSRPLAFKSVTFKLPAVLVPAPITAPVVPLVDDWVQAARVMNESKSKPNASVRNISVISFVVVKVGGACPSWPVLFLLGDFLDQDFVVMFIAFD